MPAYDPISRRKVCGGCKLQKEAAEFHARRNHGNDPLSPFCKECTKIKFAAWMEKNRQRNTERACQWRRDNIEAAKIYDKTHWQKPEVKERRRAIVSENRERYRSYGHNYRAKKNSGGTFTNKDIDRIRRAQKNKCAVCRIKLPKVYHIDHIVPISRGGSNWPRNLQLLCPACNRSKSAQDPITFMRSRGKLL